MDLEANDFVQSSSYNDSLFLSDFQLAFVYPSTYALNCIQILPLI